jgi:ketosteroid isomerase-like protein
MKIINRLSPAILLLLSLGFINDLEAQKKNAQAKEIEAVKAVIEKETKAFFEIDHQTWTDSWAHVPYAFWSFADTTDVNSFSGWRAIEQGFSEYFTTSKPSTATIERKWLEVRIFGNGAYARFTQKVAEPDLSRSEQAEVRVLEKTNGEWKIVHVGVISSKKPNVFVAK